MKKILVLGAGLVVKPLVDYFLSFEDIELTLASRSGDKGVLQGRSKSKGIVWKIDDMNKLEEMIAANDLVISLLPADYHPKVAELALKVNKPMMTTSYVSDKMKEFDSLAKEKNLLFLNECGVDPGMDHMSAMKIIHAVRGKGGKVKKFYSFCGGLPAPEAANNPLKYKFSWSPKGVLIAATNSAKYLKDGEAIPVDGDKLFYNCQMIDVKDVSSFQGYPNRDSTVYKEIYDLKFIETLFRGTLRYPGHCVLWSRMVKLGLFSKEEFEFSKDSTHKDLMCKLVPNSKPESIIEDTAKYIDTPPSGEIMEKIKWLGVFSDELLGVSKISPIDAVSKLMLKKMVYADGERDMIVMKHMFEVEYPDKKEEITSTFVYFGTPNGDTSMAQTVSLPIAIAAKLYLDGKIKLSGVRIPVYPEIYNPILDELEKLDMIFVEEVKEK